MKCHAHFVIDISSLFFWSGVGSLAFVWCCEGFIWGASVTQEWTGLQGWYTCWFCVCVFLGFFFFFWGGGGVGILKNQLFSYHLKFSLMLKVLKMVQLCFIQLWLVIYLCVKFCNSSLHPTRVILWCDELKTVQGIKYGTLVLLCCCYSYLAWLHSFWMKSILEQYLKSLQKCSTLHNVCDKAPPDLQ